MPDVQPERQVAPISRNRVVRCRESAEYWVRELPRYADRKQFWADFWSLAAGILAALTSLSIFPVLNDQAPDWQKGVVAIAAFAAAICALFPRVKNYGELAGQARELSSRYGGVVGDLVDLEAANPFPADAARAIVDEFESIKAKKDGLRGMPDRQRSHRPQPRQGGRSQPEEAESPPG